MNWGIAQELTKKTIGDVRVDIPVVSPTQEVVKELAVFLRKYSTNGTIPLATFTSLITFTLSYFIGSALASTKIGNQNICEYVVTTSIISLFLILSLTLNSWYRTIAKSKKTGSELLNSDLNKDGRGKIDKIKIILDFEMERILEYTVPVALNQVDDLRQQIRENRYRILLLSIPTVIPTITLLAILVANEFNIKNLYIGIPLLISLFSISLVKLGFTLHRAKQNKIGDYAFPQFSNIDILLGFKNKNTKITIINEQLKRQNADKEEDKKETENKKEECYSDTPTGSDKERDESLTRSNSNDTMHSVDNSNTEQTLSDTKNRQEKSKPWFGDVGEKVGEALGKKIAQPIEEVVCAVEETCACISKAAQKVEQVGNGVSELKVSIKQMCKDVSKAAEQVRQTSTDISKFIKRLEPYLPGENDNTCLKMSLESILPILEFKLKDKNDGGYLDDKIGDLVDGKVIVVYKTGSTLESAVPAKNIRKREIISNFTELHIEGLNMIVDKDGFNFKS